MEPGLQKRVQRYGWDKASPFYEDFWHAQLRPVQDLLIETADLQPGEQVLDVACGTGLVSFAALADLGPEGSVLGTDISERMIEKAAAAAEERKEARARFQRMDAEELDLPKESFDTVLCSLGLMYIPDPSQALREMCRVLKPGGRAIASVWGQRSHCGWAEIFGIVDRHVSSEVCPMFFQLGNPGVLELSFKTAGFKSIHVQQINTHLSYKDDQEALGAAFEGGPVALAYFKFSEAVKSQVQAAYLESIAQYKKDGGYEVPAEFVVAVGMVDG